MLILIGINSVNKEQYIHHVIAGNVTEALICLFEFLKVIYATFHNVSYTQLVMFEQAKCMVNLLSIINFSLIYMIARLA